MCLSPNFTFKVIINLKQKLNSLSRLYKYAATVKCIFS